MKLFSIITVCLNAEKEIEGTIRSVLEQDYDNFEYIIQDGASSDRTVKLAESFAPAFAEKGIAFRIISCSDQGIYDAMNKATKVAQGEWIVYMNAGDCFADGKILSQVSRNENLETADVIYGDVILQDEDWYLYKNAYSLETIRLTLPFCHQSAFTRRELFDSLTFSLKYRICSDYHFYLQMYYMRKKFVYLPMAISIHDVNGISSDGISNRKERLKIYEEMPVRDEKAIQVVKDRLEEETKSKFMHEHLWKFIPPKILKIKRNILRRKSGWKTEKEFFSS